MKTHHKIGLAVPLVLIIAVIVAILAGFWAGYHYPYKTLPKPPLPPTQVAPPSDCPHVMGGCLPKPKSQAQNVALITRTGQGVDLSNNNPIYSSASWAAIAAHNAFAVFKINQGTGFIDSTAKAMAFQARAHGLVVGGYDFLVVCSGSPTAEADTAIRAARYDYLLSGPRTLPITGDAEYPLGALGCNARAWIGAWVNEIKRVTGRQPLIYTGAWWWQPHVGAYWPNPSLAWISGYGVRYPYMPSGRSQLDMWQFTSSGWNGAASSDLTLWRDGAKAFYATSGVVVHTPRRLARKWRGALTSSEKVYQHLACGVLSQRQRWFSARVNRGSSATRTSRRRALSASRTAYRGRHCDVYAKRIGYYRQKVASIT